MVFAQWLSALWWAAKELTEIEKMGTQAMQWQTFGKVSLAVMWDTAAQTNLLIWLKRSSKLTVSVVVPFKFNRLHVVVIKLGERCGGEEEAMK